MLKYIMVAALCAGAAADCRAAPPTYRFYFDHFSNPHCPYMTLTVSGNVAAGYASTAGSDTGESCHKGYYAGGFIATGFHPEGLNFGVFQITRRSHVWMITTDEPDYVGIETVLFLNPAAGTWAVAVPGPGGGPFSIVNAGTMAVTSTQ